MPPEDATPKVVVVVSAKVILDLITANTMLLILSTTVNMMAMLQALGSLPLKLSEEPLVPSASLVTSVPKRAPSLPASASSLLVLDLEPALFFPLKLAQLVLSAKLKDLPQSLDITELSTALTLFLIVTLSVSLLALEVAWEEDLVSVVNVSARQDSKEKIALSMFN